jgi:hypothetical protein
MCLGWWVVFSPVTGISHELAGFVFDLLPMRLAITCDLILNNL